MIIWSILAVLAVVGLSQKKEFQLPLGSLAKRIMTGSMLGGYPTFKEAETLLNSLRNRYPAYVSEFIVGQSVESRIIKAWWIGENAVIHAKEAMSANKTIPTPPVLLLTSLHHAREPASLTVVLNFATQVLDLAHEAYLNPLDNSMGSLAGRVSKNLLLTRGFVILPFVNPDGYVAIETTGDTSIRKNRRQTCPSGGTSGKQGVDLNRNYDYNFASLHTPCDPEEYEGPSAFSEPETQAVKRLVENIRPVAALNFHGYGGFWTRPYNCCKDKDVPEAARQFYEELAQAVNVTDFGPAPRMPLLMYSATGEADDWMLSAAGVLAMSPEVGNEYYGFWPPKEIVPYINEESYWHILDVAIKIGPSISASITRDGRVNLMNHGQNDLHVNDTLDVVAFKLDKDESFANDIYFASAGLEKGYSPHPWTREFVHRRLEEKDIIATTIIYRSLDTVKSRQTTEIGKYDNLEGEIAVCVMHPEFAEGDCYCTKLGVGTVSPLIPFRQEDSPCEAGKRRLGVERAVLYSRSTENKISQIAVDDGESLSSPLVHRFQVAIAILEICGALVALHAILMFVGIQSNALSYGFGRFSRRYAKATSKLFCCFPCCLRLSLKLESQEAAPPKVEDV